MENLIGGTEVRDMLIAGEHPPEKIMRMGTVEILIDACKRADL